jgi:hypothetical protein
MSKWRKMPLYYERRRMRKRTGIRRRILSPFWCKIKSIVLFLDRSERLLLDTTSYTHYLSEIVSSSWYVASKDLRPADLNNGVDAVRVVRIAGEQPVLNTVYDFATFVPSEEVLSFFFLDI